MAKTSKQSKKKVGGFWIGLICFVIVAAILVGLTGWRTGGFKDWTYGFKIPTASAPDETDKPGDTDKDPDGDITVTPDPGEASGISLMSRRIPREEYAAYGVSEEAESANVIHAVFTPEHGKYDNIQWSLQWENPNSELAQDFDPPAFVTIDTFYCDPVTGQLLDGYAILSRMEPFGETIILTCAVTVNGTDLVKTCRVECPCIPEGAFGYDPSSGLEPSITLENIKTQTLSMDYKWSVGSVKPDTVTGDLVLTFDSTVMSYLMGYNYTFPTGGIITYSGNQLLDDEFRFGLDLSKLLAGEYNETTFWNDLYDALRNCPSIFDGAQPIMTINATNLEFSLNGENLGSFFAIVNVYSTDYSNIVTWVTDFELSKDVMILF